jgi:hypothetical protein
VNETEGATCLMRASNPVKAFMNFRENVIKSRICSLVAIVMPGIRPDLKKKNAHCQKIDEALSSTSKECQLITDILKRMSERQALLTEDLSKRIIRPEILLNIQKELRKEWKPQTSYSASPSPQDEIIRITLDTFKRINFYDDTFEEDDLRFTLRIGWKLAEYHLGLTQQMEADEQYLAIKEELIEQMASISNEDINNLLGAYLNFSFAMNSGYILSSYLITNPKLKGKLQENFSPGRIKEVRDKGLNSLLSYNQTLMEEVLKSNV